MVAVVPATSSAMAGWRKRTGLDPVVGPGCTAEVVGAAEALIDPAGILEVAALVEHPGLVEVFPLSLVQAEAVVGLAGGVEEPVGTMALASNPSRDSLER